jgi:hypothetical protein
MKIFCTVKQRDAEDKKAFPQQVMRTQDRGMEYWVSVLPLTFGKTRGQ